jgi:hypothetical protein
MATARRKPHPATTAKKGSSPPKRLTDRERPSNPYGAYTAKKGSAKPKPKKK